MKKESISDKSPKKHKIARVVLKVLILLFALLFTFVLLLNIPAVQTYITKKLVQGIREKTGTELSIGSVQIAFPKNVNLRDVYIEDQKKDTLLYLHSLSVNIELFGLLKNKLNINSVELENVVANIHRENSDGDFNFQFILNALSSQPKDTSSKPSTPWDLNVKNISLKNIRGSFLDANSGIDLKVDLNSLQTSIKDLDVARNKYHFSDLHLETSNVLLSLSIGNVDNSKLGIAKNKSEASSNASFSEGRAKLFSGLDISVDDIALNKINFQFDNNEFEKTKQGIDYNHFHLTNFNSEIKGATISEEGLLAVVNKMDFSESCGLNVNRLSGQLKLTEQIAELKKLFLETSSSKISVDAKLSFNSIAELSSDLGNCNVELDLDQSTLSTSELELFVPELTSSPSMKQFRNENIFVGLKGKGKVNDIAIEQLNVSALKKTTLALHGNVTGLPDMKNIRFNTKIDLLSTILPDVYKFVDPKSFAGINLPQAMNLNGNVEGNLNSIRTDLNFNSELGNVKAIGFYKSEKSKKDTFNIDFEAKNVYAEKIVGNSALGYVTLSGNASGTRKNNALSGRVKLNVDEFDFNSYKYRTILIAGDFIGDSISTKIESNDPNAMFDLFANANVSEKRKSFYVDANFAKVNLKALGFSEQDISASTNLNATLNYSDVNNSDGYLILSKTNLSNNKKKAVIKSLDLTATTTNEGFKVAVKSDLIDGNVSGNIRTTDLKKTFVSVFKKYFNAENSQDPVIGKHLDFAMNVHCPKEVMDVIAPNLKTLEISKFSGNYSSDNNVVNVELKMPEIIYSGIQIDSLNLIATGKNEKLILELVCDKIAYSNLSAERLMIIESTENGKILSKISVEDSTGKSNYLLANEFEIGSDLLKMRFLPNGLVLNGNVWNVPADNYFQAESLKNNGSKKKYIVNNFVFSNSDQSFGIETEDLNHHLLFKNFELQNLLNIVEYRLNGISEAGGKFLRGDLNGEINIPVNENNSDYKIDLAIKDLYIRDTLAGDLAFIVNVENDKMDLDAGLISNNNNVKVKGSATNYAVLPELNLDASVDINDLHALENFTFGNLSEMNGKLNGEIHVTGTPRKPEMNGNINFDQAVFRVNSLNFLAKIENDKIIVSDKGFHFDKFTIKDVNEKKLMIDGDIFTTDYLKYNFDINLSAKEFQPVNSTITDNKTLYGKLSMGADVNIKGDINSPEIKANIEIDSATNLTYALPGSELKLVTSEGIVQFLDSLQLLDSSMNSAAGDFMTDSIISKMKGMNLDAHIEINQGSRFTIDIDPNSGDYLTVIGKAKLDISSDGATGNQTINGIYEVNSGFYQLSFYDLVKKDFTITPGSTIAWSGRPMDADLNITAEYIVRTTSVGLVANETSSMSEEEKKIFNKRLPYEVKLNIRGFLAKPEISFSISLPQQYLSDNPLVETKLRQLNTEENVAQLNKQVFALLVAGSFMAENPTVASGSSTNNLASTAARNSVNGILASQLNNMSSKYISGVDVNFGLTSYDDYASSSGDTRTEMDIQVSKKLFNDRITVEAENSYGLKNSKNQNSSPTSSQGYGQFAVIYSLDEAGEYKLRAYYQNTYDPFDGDISYSGFAVIFEKEFDRAKKVKAPVPQNQGENKK